MREIGGYFGLESLKGQPLYADLIDFNCARSALLWLVRERNYKGLCLPYYLCGCVRQFCGRFAVPVRFYHVGSDLLPETDPKLRPGEALYLVNYYGQRSEAELRAWKERTANLIVDNVQAYFTPPIPGIDTIYSCRKFFGVPDGAWLATELPRKFPVPERDRAEDRMRHLIGRLEADASSYYGDFKRSDDSFEDTDLRSMSRTAQNLLRAIDYEGVKAARERNFRTIEKALKDRGGLPVHRPEGPYAYPFLLPDGTDGPGIRRALAAQKIYIPTLWPDLAEESSDWEKRLAAQLLPLPCDQRCSEEDLQFMLQQLEALL